MRILHAAGRRARLAGAPETVEPRGPADPGRGGRSGRRRTRVAAADPPDALRGRPAAHAYAEPLRAERARAAGRPARAHRGPANGRGRQLKPCYPLLRYERKYFECRIMADVKQFHSLIQCRPWY